MFRRFITFSLSSLLIFGLSACSTPAASDTSGDDTPYSSPENDTGSSSFPDSEASESSASSVSESDSTAVESNTDSVRTAYISGPDGSISISVPENMDYELLEVDEENLVCADYGINLFFKDDPDNYVQIGHGFLGVCGTGLEEKEITLAGDTAYCGFYDGSDKWDFIIFEGEEFFVNNFFSDKWSEDISSELISVLDTLEFNTTSAEKATAYNKPDSENHKYGIVLSAKNITPKKALLKVRRYKKDSDYEITFGEDFILEKKTKDGWKEVDLVVDGAYGYNDVAHIVSDDYDESGSAYTTYKYNWAWLYSKIGKGKYRIRVNFQVFDNDALKDSFSLYAYFKMRNLKKQDNRKEI